MAINSTFRIKQNDLLPQLKGRFLDKKTLAPQSLEGAALEFHMMAEDGTIKINAPALPVLPQTDPDNEGRWYYDWQPGDTDTAGVFQGEVQATFGSQPLTSPNSKNFKVVIFPEIA